MLNDAGFPDTMIVLSNNLDELVIWQIISQIEAEAPRYGVDPDHLIGRLAYGVGTRLITSHGKAALDGVYKLVAVEEDGRWVPALKISETPEKTLNPGNKNVWRIYDGRGKAIADLLGVHDEDPMTTQKMTLHHPFEKGKQRTIDTTEIKTEPLLKEVLRENRQAGGLPTIEEMRAIRKADVERLDEGVKRLVNPHIYHVSLTDRLLDLKQELVKQAQGKAGI